MTILQSLPEIVKREIEHPIFKNSGEKIIETLNTVSSMVGIKFDVSTKEGKEEKKITGANWISFCQGYQLTGLEIIEAYRMALRKDFPEIKVFPNLSLITAGEILKAYQEFKHGSEEWNKGRKKISSALNPVLQESEDVKKSRREKMWNELLQKVENNEPCVYAGHFYSELDSKGCFSGLTASDKNALIRSKMHQILTKEVQKGKSVHFRIKEVKKLLNELEENQIINNEFLKGLAIQLVKDDLVYNYLKNNKNET